MHRISTKMYWAHRSFMKIEARKVTLYSGSLQRGFCANCPEHILCVLPWTHSFYKLCKFRYQGAAPTAVQLRLVMLRSEFQEIRRREGSTRVPWHRTIQSLESSESLSKVCAMLSTSWKVPTDRQTDIQVIWRNASLQCNTVRDWMLAE
jgi:hypothetical protein